MREGEGEGQGEGEGEGESGTVDKPFRAFMDASFGIASMDGAIDGIAY